MKKILDWIKSSKSDLVLFIIFIVLLNLVCFKSFKRIDLTKDDSFSLSKASKDVIKQLQNPLVVNVFFDEDLPASYSQTSKYLKDLLEEYKNIGNKNFIVNYMDMKKEENIETASQFGIQKVSDTVYNNSGVSVKLDYRGIAITYGTEVEVINPISSTNGLEYTLTSTFTKLISSADMLSSLKPGEKIKISLFLSQALYNTSPKVADKISFLFEQMYESIKVKMEDRVEFENIIVPQDQSNLIGEKYGFYQIQDTKNQNFFMGVTVSLGENFKVLPYNLILDYGNTLSFPQIEGTESEIISGIQSLLNKTNKIGYITGHQELPSKQSENPSEQNQAFSVFSAISNDSYSIVDINLISQDIPTDMNTIIICESQEDYTEEELYKLDQFVMRGGNLIVFMNSVRENMYYNFIGGPQYYEGSNNIDTLLDAYGIKRNNDIILDRECLIDYKNSDYYYWYLSIPRERVSNKSVITKNLGDIAMYIAGSLDINKAEEKGYKTTVLINSSKDSWSELIQDFNPQKKNMQPSSQAISGPLNLAVLVEAKFNSAFEKTPDSLLNKDSTEYQFNNFISSSKKEGKIFVCGTSNLVNALYYSPNNSQNALLFVSNVLDYMNGNEDLCEMRTKGRSMDVLNVKSQVLAKIMQYFNEIGIPLLVVLAGVFVYISRKNKRKFINEKYNPDDKRTIEK